MVFMCADDYGLDEISSMHIQECIDRGALHRVSVFPNFEKVDLARICKYRKIQLSLHLNLVEGTCMANAGELVLNKSQQGNLASQLSGGGMQNMKLDAVITGEQIRLVLNNNGRRTGRGEYVQTKSGRV